MAKKKTDKERRIQIPVRLEAAWADRLDRIIYWTGRGRTKQNLLEKAVKRLIEEIEREENRGKSFNPIPKEE